MTLLAAFPNAYWGRARVEREQLPVGVAIAGCWAVLKQRYGIAKYEHLPATHDHSCVDFIKRAYQALTGEGLTGEQLRLLDFDEP